jgi:hypothetical protein
VVFACDVLPACACPVHVAFLTEAGSAVGTALLFSFPGGCCDVQTPQIVLPRSIYDMAISHFNVSMSESS